jgi:hypothetical protein
MGSRDDCEGARGLPSLRKAHRANSEANKPHWKLADQALRQASKSAAVESRASAAFKAAIEAEGCTRT